MEEDVGKTARLCDCAVEVVRRPVSRHLAVSGGLIEVDVDAVPPDGLRA
jgi:hypothetical protein